MFYQKLTLGIDASSSLKELLDFGIRQFYASYIPPLWLDTYGSQQSLNRRYLKKEQFYEREHLHAITGMIHQCGGTLSLTLNAPFQTAQMLHYSQEVIGVAKEISVDSLIVGNLALLEWLKNDTLPITLSTTLGIYSSASVAFFVERYRPKRIVLPRDMLKSEIASIVGRFPDTQFEVFLYGDTCRWSDGHCFVEHGYDSIDKGLPFCVHLKNTLIIHARPNLMFKHIIAKKNDPALLLKTSHIEKQVASNDIRPKDEFSKTSSVAIKESLEFFAQFPNIVGYKIPSRGRDALKLLSYLDEHSSTHHFQTALYK